MIPQTVMCVCGNGFDEAFQFSEIAKPVLMNEALRMHWQERKQHVDLWKNLGFYFVKTNHIENVDNFRLIVRHYVHKSRGRYPDVDALAFVLKAFVDGMVHANLTPDDSMRYFRGLCINPVMLEELPAALEIDLLVKYTVVDTAEST